MDLFKASALLVLFTQCPDSGQQKPLPQQPPTAKEAITQLEAQGELPVLDRTDSVPGVDADGDGLRDDIDLYIDGTSYDDSQKLVLKKFSAAMTAAMTASASGDAALRAATDKINVAVKCIYKKFPDEAADSVLLEIKKITVNTRSRYDAYMQYNSAVAGSVITLPKNPNCE